MTNSPTTPTTGPTAGPTIYRPHARYVLITAIAALSIPALIWLVSCSEDWLTPKPLSIFTPENAFVDARGMYGALTACERNIRYEFYGDGAPMITELIFSEVCVRMMRMR